MLYPENRYAIEIAENPHSNTFSVWFKQKPEDLVFHLLRTMKFRDRSYGKEFYHPNDTNARRFAEELQQTLRNGCLPEVAHYTPTYEPSESSITTGKYSIATIHYTNDEAKTVQSQFLLFENSRLIRKSLAWLIGFIQHGEALSKVETTEKVKKKEALNLYHDGIMKVKLPIPFGYGLPDENDLLNNNSYNGIQHGKNHRMQDGKANKSKSLGTSIITSVPKLSELVKANGKQVGKKVGIHHVNNLPKFLKERMGLEKVIQLINRPTQTAPIIEPFTSIYTSLFELMPDLVNQVRKRNTHDDSFIQIDENTISRVMIEDEVIENNGRFEIRITQTNANKHVSGKTRCTDIFFIIVRIDPNNQVAESVYYEDNSECSYVYQYFRNQIFVDVDQRVKQNTFLLKLLNKYKAQGHLIDLGFTIKSEKDYDLQEEFRYVF